jgi:hypothetical protein
MARAPKPTKCMNLTFHLLPALTNFISRYIDKLIQEDNAWFGKKQSPACALLLACEPKAPPPPITLNAPLRAPLGTLAESGALENQYAEGNYDRDTYRHIGGLNLGENQQYGNDYYQD